MKNLDNLLLELQEQARKYTEETYNNPTPEDYLIIHNCFIKGAQLALNKFKQK